MLTSNGIPAVQLMIHSCLDDGEDIQMLQQDDDPSVPGWTPLFPSVPVPPPLPTFLSASGAEADEIAETAPCDDIDSATESSSTTGSGSDSSKKNKRVSFQT